MPDFHDSRLTLPSGGEGLDMQVTAGLVTLRNAPRPDAETVSQILHGEQVVLHHREGEFGLIQNTTDRYVGWAHLGALSEPVLAPTHRLRALRAYVYPEPSIKSAPQFEISLGATLVGEDQRDGRFLKCARAGWVYEDQLVHIDEYDTDPAEIAYRYMHAPYLWGGRESVGVDCSGLIQQAFAACGVSLPRDSDMQSVWAGDPLAAWDQPGTLSRNDLIFWKGHVGIMLDSKTLLHANGFHMAVAAEPLAGSIARIAQQYGEPIGARRVNIDLEKSRQPDWLQA